MTKPGQKAYELYCAASNNKSLVTGTPLPHWDDLPERIRAAWFVVETGLLAAPDLIHYPDVPSCDEDTQYEEKQ